ncbi:universal stress protein [Lipingzhangella sp. LS1_29]|uniref:Universal stress protein n=1 Tax=Lipingzhangella rawalii TaxID=2055835 RepID=A0ABU2HC46_9ACTN|nr:universal stress protein [Lipingzhangella rawalii]MDS1272375.1 universal stress protein [Lipingzhangella rawalii]
MSQPAPVVVGVDGSEEALAAVTWAAGEAELMGRPLRVVHAAKWGDFPMRFGSPPKPPEWSGLADVVQQVVAEAEQHARKSRPGLEVTGEAIDGFVRPVLLAEANEAALMVVGSRGLGGVGSVLIGSIGVELAARAACPVVVVPHGPTAEPDAEIVVGVDCSDSSRPAAEFAFAEAHRRGVSVVVTMAWEGPGRHADSRDEEPPAEHEATRQTAQKRLDAFVEPLRKEYPGVVAHVGVRFATARTFLAERAEHAGMLVVGSRGYGAARGLFMGSVSQAALHHAPCPVAVVPFTALVDETPED